MQPHGFDGRLTKVFMQPIAAWIDFGLHHHGNPEVRVLAHGLTVKSRRRNANHDQIGLGHVNGGTQHRGFSSETALPVVVADDYIRIGSYSFRVLGSKGAANSRFHTEKREIVDRKSTRLNSSH